MSEKKYKGMDSDGCYKKPRELFDPKNIEHMKALQHVFKYGDWPEHFWDEWYPEHVQRVMLIDKLPMGNKVLMEHIDLIVDNM